MKENNSEWLNDTLPDKIQKNDNKNIVKDFEEKDIKTNKNDTDTINGKEKESEKVNTQTLYDLVKKIKIEETSIEDKYLDGYIGPNCNKFSYKIFSIPGLIFGPLYIFYRKMYLLGIITLFFQVLLIAFINPYISLIINFLIFIFFNSFYVSYAKRKIEKIKHLTGSKDFANIINICCEKGGVNKKAFLFAFLLQIVILILVILYFPSNSYLKKFKNLIYPETIIIKNI